jgi:Endo-alpha-N-acetylgalactosaminidase
MLDFFLRSKQKILLSTLVFGSWLAMAGGGSKDTVIANKALQLDISSQIPFIYSIYDKTAGLYFKGVNNAGAWIINGQKIPWSQWRISFHSSDSSASYRMFLPSLQIEFDYRIILTSQAVNFSLDHISDLHHRLQTICWKDAPLLQVTDTAMHWWARKTRLWKPWVKKKVANRGLWDNFECSGSIGDSIPADNTMDACLWSHNKVAIGLVSNIDLFPIAFYGGSAGATLGLNHYYYRLAGHIMKPMKATLIFIGDQNGDHQVNDKDYFLWRNRHLKDVSFFLLNALSYKVFMDIPPLQTPATTLQQLRKIVGAIHGITDGLPQIVYIVGWQYRGHDTGYPGLDQWNRRLGPHQMVYQIAKYFREHLNTCLSYHINIDDAYKGNKDYLSTIMATDYDGGPMYWQMGTSDSCFHISHYKDVQTGYIFKRLKQFLQTVPVSKVVHIDAMRSTNCNPAWEKDSIGIADELELGLKPILQFLNQKGIAVTTEGQNGMPHELTGLVAGFYHLQAPSVANLMIYHRKLIGGGWLDGRGRLECGLGTSLHQDISYSGKNNTVNFIKDWKAIKERIYLGSMLYRYYMGRHLINVNWTRDSISLYFDDNTVTYINRKSNQLLVKRGDITIALNDDRFIPFGNNIYAFSKTGSDRQWLLPKKFRNKSLVVFSLTAKGRGAVPAYELTGDSIRLKLLADVPVKIELK